MAAAMTNKPSIKLSCKLKVDVLCVSENNVHLQTCKAQYMICQVMTATETTRTRIASRRTTTRDVSDTWKCGGLSFIFAHPPEDKKQQQQQQ